MKCPNCNRNNRPGAKYCYNCGVALSKRPPRKAFLGRIPPIIFIPFGIGILFDSLMALALLTMPLVPLVWHTAPPGGWLILKGKIFSNLLVLHTAPPGGWGLFSPGVWRLIYLGGGISLVLALLIFFVRGSPPIVGVPLVIVGFIISAYLIPDFFGKLSDAAAWKSTNLILLSCYILNIFTISLLIKRLKRELVILALTSLMLILTFYFPQINKWLINKGISTGIDKVQLLSPKDGSILPPGDLTLSWARVNNATKYEVMIYNEAGKTIIDKTTSSTSFKVTLKEGRYRWSVRARDNTGKWTPWSDKRFLTITAIKKDVIAKKPSQVKTGFLSVNSNPTGADIFIDGNLIKDTTPLNNYQLKPGTHSIRISMYGYLDYTSSIQISENQVTNLGVISLRLSPIQNGFLTLNSNPTGADIFIDGNLIKDTTPLNNYQLKPGTHSIRISMYGYKDSIRNIYIEANKTLSISVTLEKLEETFTMHSYGISPAKEKIVLQVGSNIITVDDKNTYHIETGPEIKDGRTFIPLIPVSEALGYNLEWFPDSKSIRLVKGDILIELQIGNEVEVIKDTDPDLGWSRKVSSGGSPFIKNNEIMVPVQFIGEVPDIAELTWDALTITIHLKG